MTIRRALPLALLAAACAPRMLPGTEVKDTPENRAMYDVVDAYVKAMNKRDAAAVLVLVAPDYFDDAGTPEPGDDLDRAALEKSLAKDLGRLETERLALTIRKIEARDQAGFVEVFYDNYYRVQTPAGPIARRDTDVHHIRMKKEAGKWLIVGGL